MSVKFIASFKGSKQGQIKGSNHDKWLKIECFSLEIKESAGQSSGASSSPGSQFSGVAVTRAVDSASPALYQALVTNEALHVVVEERFHSQVVMKVTLHNAIISKIEPIAKPPAFGVSFRGTGRRVHRL